MYTYSNTKKVLTKGINYFQKMLHYNRQFNINKKRDPQKNK